MAQQAPLSTVARQTPPAAQRAPTAVAQQTPPATAQKSPSASAGYHRVPTTQR
jgi:hypothetical protein